MHAITKITPSDRSDKDALHRSVAEELRSLITDERDWLVNTANAAALLFHSLPDLNWAGFYFHRGSQLVLGPFQGKPACMRIELGRGVCGTAASERRTIVVPNVHEFLNTSRATTRHDPKLWSRCWWNTNSWAFST